MTSVSAVKPYKTQLLTDTPTLKSINTATLTHSQLTSIKACCLPFTSLDFSIGDSSLCLQDSDEALKQTF